MNLILFCPLFQLIFCSMSLIIHMIALLANYWEHFSARTELGLPEEVGHYGLWGLCSIKAPLYRDDCDPLDTFFRPPHHMLFAGVIASIHAIVLGLFLPFSVIRLQQITRNKPNFLVKTKTIVSIKVSLILISLFLVSLTLLLTTLRETISREQIIFNTSTLDNYHIRKGWAFWLEIAVSFIGLLILIFCLIENKKLKKLEALGFTPFIANPSPNSLMRLNTTSEYFNPNFQRISHSNRERDPISTISDPSKERWIGCNPQNCQLFNKTHPNLPFPTISFNNPAFLNESPDMRRHKPFNDSFDFI